MQARSEASVLVHAGPDQRVSIARHAHAFKSQENDTAKILKLHGSFIMISTLGLCNQF
jgi:hypothetical protein